MILNGSVSNSNGNIPSNNINPDNINDYMYDMIFIKTKKAVNTNIQKNKKLLQKYNSNDSNINNNSDNNLAKSHYSPNMESIESRNVNNIINNDSN